MSDELKTNELANEVAEEQQLEDVAGGGWSNAEWFYSSGKTPRFSVGQRVNVDRNVFEHKSSGSIARIDGGMSGKINKEFTYTVRFDDGTFESGVYESQMLKHVGGEWIPL